MRINMELNAAEYLIEKASNVFEVSYTSDTQISYKPMDYIQEKVKQEDFNFYDTIKNSFFSFGFCDKFFVPIETLNGDNVYMIIPKTIKISELKKELNKIGVEKANQETILKDYKRLRPVMRGYFCVEDVEK